MIKYCRLPFHFDVPRLQQELDALLRSDWQLHYQTRHYHGEWSGLPLRSIGGDPGSMIVSPEENPVYADTVFLQSSPYFTDVLRRFECPLQGVRLLKLAAGAEIKEHKDADLYFEKGEIRLHIPIVTNPRVQFLLDQEQMHLLPGECWYMNFNLPHALHNQSQEDRVHLVIDALVNDWVTSLFATPGLLKKEIDEPMQDEATSKQIIAQLRAMNTETGHRLADEMEATLSLPHAY